MWHIESIKARNIISFKDVSYNISKGVTTLIFGQNLDNENQKHNGSGKSSLCEAIAFGLTGESFKKVKSLDEIINNYEEEAEVDVVLFNSYDNTRFSIYRRISRKDPQCIECHLYNADGDEISRDITVQPTVNDYNKFILDMIGLSKDDLYYNYLLNRKRFKCFLTASDKDKKEIINRFSNGVIVDDSIAEIDADLEPLKEDKNGSDLKIAHLNGKISVIEEQIANADVEMANAMQSRQSRIDGIKVKIGDTRKLIQDNCAMLDKAEKRMSEIRRIDSELQKLEEANMGVEKSYEAIKTLFEQNHIVPIADYANRCVQLNESLKNYKHSLECENDELSKLREQHDEMQKNYDELNEKYSASIESHREMVDNSNLSINDIRDEIDEHRQKMAKYDEMWNLYCRKVGSLNGEIASINVALKGAITCPKCKHQFMVNSEMSIDEAEGKKSNLEKEIEDINQKKIDVEQSKKDCDTAIVTLNGKIADIQSKINSSHQAIASDGKRVAMLANSIDSVNSKIKERLGVIDSIGVSLNGVKKQIEQIQTEMFDSAFAVIDEAIEGGKKYMSSLNGQVSSAKASIETYEQTILDIQNTKIENIKSKFLADREIYTKELNEEHLDNDNIKAEIDKLEMQKIQFQSFKSYLANQKIEAISEAVNGFLEEIGSDMSVELSGYKTLKTGKIRENITVNLLRDGVDQGDFAKFSGGEQARIILASILAMAKLTNANCEPGKGLDLLVLDEILDASDDSGFISFTDAINHLGVTCLMITQGATVEGYPHQLIIQKEGGYSTIIQ